MPEHIQGIEKLSMKLKTLPNELRVEAEVNMTRRAAMHFARKARKRVPVRMGTLKKSLGVKRISKKGASKIVYVVHHRTGRGAKHDGWYAHLVEFGTTPHIIKATRAKALGRRGQFGIQVEHPGMRAQPYLGKTFDECVDEVIKDSGKQLDKFLEKKAKAA